MNVVVIGGGVIGYSVAHELAANRVDVLVIDMRRPGGGATHASAGILAPYIEGHQEPLRRLGVQSLSMYDEFINQLTLEATTSVEYRRSGTLQVAWSPERAAELERAAERLNMLGVEHSLLNGDGVHHHEGELSRSIRRGLLVPAQGYVHVADLMTALVSAASRRGVRTLTDRVVGIERSPKGVGIVTSSDRIEASAVVLAAGSWSGRLSVAQSPQVPVTPIKGQVVELKFPTPPLSHVVWSEDCYLVPWRSGSVIVGATVEDVGFDESPTSEALDSLIASAKAVLPQAGFADVRESRVGLRPATRDELPLVGWSSTMPGVCLATGHYRNGILLAPLTAALVAETVIGVETEQNRWARICSPHRAWACEAQEVYTSREVAALTGLTARQLQWWDSRRLFTPAVARIAPRRAASPSGATHRSTCWSCRCSPICGGAASRFPGCAGCSPRCATSSASGCTRRSATAAR